MSARPERIVMAALLCSLLAACGGGGNGGGGSSPVVPTAAVPAEASESSAGLVRYLQALAASPADDLEPVDLSTFKPKTPQDTEPEPVS